MSTFPLVSIVTAYYNSEDFFEETVNSILDQSFLSWEWIIIDDGSSAQSRQKLSEIINNLSDERILVFHQKINKGLPFSRNLGITNAKSNYVFFIDSDDLIERTALEKFYIFLETNRLHHFVNSYVKGFGKQNYLWTGGFHEGLLFLSENRNTSCFLARKSVFEHVLFDESMKDGCEDWEFWLNTASKKYRGYTIPEFLFHYRRKAESNWATLSSESNLTRTKKRLQEKYGAVINKNGFPDASFDPFDETNTANNQIQSGHSIRKSKELLCILPWLEVGGADNFNLSLFSGLKTNGWNITIITTESGNHLWADKFKELQIDIYHLANLAPQYQFHNILQYFIIDKQPSLIFLCNSLYGYRILPFLKVNYPHLPIIDFLHCEEEKWHSGGYPAFSLLYSEYIHTTFVASKHLEKWMKQKKDKSQKIQVQYIGVDSDYFKPNAQIREKTRKGLNIEPSSTLILFVGRLTPQKQPDVFVNTLKILKENNIEFKAVMLGDGPERKIIERLIRKHRLTNYITMHGNCEPEKVKEFYNASDIFFLPSSYEGIALSIYEAMAMSLPIVGADVGGQDELVSKDEGWLILPSNKKIEAIEYAQILKNLCLNISLRETIGRNARKKIENLFSLQSVIKSMNAELDQIGKDTEQTHASSNNGIALAQSVGYIFHLEKQLNSTSLLDKIFKKNHYLKSIVRKLILLLGGGNE